MFKKIVLLLLLNQSISAMAAVKYLDDVLKKAQSGEAATLAQMLGEIKLVPVTDPETGNSVFKVTAVTPGSAYDKAGIKVGDLVSAGHAPKANP